MTWVVVAREREAGLVSIGVFLVDVWCLGVKDAYADELTRAEFQELLEEQIPAGEREAFAPADAKRLIEGAVAYAQSLRFLPHRDFRKARKVLSGIEADPSAGGAAREFTFGCEGKPRFVIGPDDDDARVTRVIAVLTARFGADGFVVEEFDDPDGVDDEDREAVLEVMDAMFRFVESPHCRDRSLSGFFVQGFVAAALLIEPARECDAWWRELFGGKEPELPDNEEFQPEDIIEGFLELCNDTEDSFTVDDFTPSLPPLDQPDHFSAAADFCRGVLHVIDARPEVGAWLDAGADVSGALATLRRLAALPSEGPTDMTGRRDVARGIGDALRALDAAVVERRT